MGVVEGGQGEIEGKSGRVSRRDFLKTAGKGAVVVAGVVGGVSESAHEIEVLTKGGFEAHGVWWRPVYENWHGNHSKVLNPEAVRGLNGLGLEFADQALFSADAGRIIYAFPLGQGNFYRLISDEVLRELAWGRTKLIFGDLNPPELDLPIVEAAGGAFASFWVAKFGRREFLKKVSKGALAVLVAPWVGKVFSGVELRNLPEEQKVTSRLLARIATVSSVLKPYDLNDLFREVVQACKLLTWANKNRPDRQKLKVGFSWHQGHRAIEDWIRLGPDVCRSVILAFPNDVLKKVIEANSGDPRCLYASRVIGVGLDSSGNVRVVSDDVVEDKELEKELKNRGLVKEMTLV